jgi:hypothetical protein
MKYLVIACLLICPLLCMAQRNFVPGYVVISKGDTLKGFIDYREWARNPKSVEFKPDLQHNATETYNPDNALAFSIPGIEYYQRHTLRISEDRTQLNDLHLGLDSSSNIQTVFLRVLASGKSLTLYSYNDHI